MNEKERSITSNKTIFFLLGDTAQNLNHFLSNQSDKSSQYTIIMKKMPQFFEWIERAEKNKEYIEKLYLFLRHRQEYYLSNKKVRNAKSFLDESEAKTKESRSTETRKSLDLINTYKNIQKNLSTFRELIDEETSLMAFDGYLEFLKGFDRCAYEEDEFIQSWISDSFIVENPLLKLSFVLGRYYNRVAELEIEKMNNFGLAKELISWVKSINSSNQLDLFKKINRSYFFTLRDIKEFPKSNESNIDPLSRYRKIIVLLFDEATRIQQNAKIEDINDKLVKFCFSCGFLVRNKASRVDRGDYENLAFADDIGSKFAYDLGKLVALSTKFEITELESRSFKNILGNVRVFKTLELIKIINYTNNIMIRGWTKTQMGRSKKKSNQDKISEEKSNNTDSDSRLQNHSAYKFSNVAQRVFLYFIKQKVDLKRQNVEIAHIAFMLGYSSIPILNKNVKN